jgi:hypothetical protein
VGAITTHPNSGEIAVATVRRLISAEVIQMSDKNREHKGIKKTAIAKSNKILQNYSIQNKTATKTLEIKKPYLIIVTLKKFARTLYDARYNMAL